MIHPRRSRSPILTSWLGWGAAVLLLAGPARTAEWTPFAIGSQTTSPAVSNPADRHWFRCFLRPQENMVTPQPADLWRDSMTLTFRGVDGTLSVWLNGLEIIPLSTVRADQPARFKVPKDVLRKDVFNALVVRWDGPASAAGFPEPPLFAGYFDEVPLGPSWEISSSAPAPSDSASLSQPPSAAAYTEADFRPATTPMQATAQLERGKFVSPPDALAALRPLGDLVVDELLHEPEIAQPTHVSFDSRGRIWVSQYRQYPYPAGLSMISRDKYYRSKYHKIPPPPPHHDRGADVISVHQDTDGDGKLDVHKNVLTGLNMANAAVSGHGGIWVMHTPYLLFYPDANGDDVPDRDPEVRLAGFGLEDTHSVANGLIWGPDGWLYGAQGSTTTSRIVRPGVDPPEFTGIYNEGCMVWRYHPQKKIYEIFADGSGNTFGLSFDATGNLHSGHNGGDTRGWHHVQSGLYLKQGKDPGKFGPSPHAFAFGEMPMMKSTHAVPRFSHMLCIVEGTAMPAAWQHQLFAIDPLHHAVIAAERIPTGSTFFTTDTGVPLQTDDKTFRPVFITNAPDGSIIVADFREEYIAHGQNYQSQIDPATGRLYRLRGRDLPLEHDTNLAAKTDAELVTTLAHANVWHRQTAARVLVERRAVSCVDVLKNLLNSPHAHPALEALWVLHGLGQLDEALAMRALGHTTPAVRSWTIRLRGDDNSLSPPFLAAVMDLAAKESSALVRCQMLSTARRLPAAQALPLAAALIRRTEDTSDPFIPLLAWFVLESHCQSARQAVLALWEDPSLWTGSMTQNHIIPKLMRRFAEAGTRQDLLTCAQLLTMAPSPGDQQALMKGFEEAFHGRALPPLPDELAQALVGRGLVSPSLRLRRGENDAIAAALELLANPASDLPLRLETARTLGEIKSPAAIPVLLQIATADPNPDLRRTALAALSTSDAPEIADRLIAAWHTMTDSVQPSAVSLLSSRPHWARAALEAVARGVINKDAFTPEVVARLLADEDATVATRTKDLLAPTPAIGNTPRPPHIATLQEIIARQPGNPYRGEQIYAARCGGCHTLFFQGGKIGPNLTTYQRDDLGTMLTSIIDPNAEIREGFENYTVTTSDGRTLSGFLADSDAQGIVLRGFDGTDFPLLRSEIRELRAAGRSLMPEGLLEGLTDDQIRDLMAWLRQSQPITSP